MYAIIVANAPTFDAAPFVDRLRSADRLIAADGGANALYRAHITPHRIIGDFDSIDPTTLEHFAAAGVHMQRYPAEKDETDLELALLLAVDCGADQIDILGAMGGRWDQGLSNMALLALPELNQQRIRLLDIDQEAYLVRDAADIDGAVGDTVSLLPVGGAAHGITTHGLRYALRDATLYYERSRGISNVITAVPARVSLKAGMVLVIHSFNGAGQHR